MLCSRYVKFLEAMKSCSKGSVRYLESLVHDDRRTLTGKTLTRMANDCDVERGSLDAKTAKRMVFWKVPEEEQWRIPLLKELLDVRNGAGSIPGIEHEEVDMMINNICSS